ncbi:hypothetical protein ID866_3055 [Astraeus odoratus]|nr:hypothetical protein ID866_3055 [Astraeus odoratus]
MSGDLKAVRKKRNASETTTSAPALEGDHRKRRRNRTTQSCLNCHTSKRMCDRKRPCGRCTQLGLTGLCVYEVDDPSQRSDVQDESSRLRKRVAELEGVIRELKNKPHPRWAIGANASEDIDKWPGRAQSRPQSEGPQAECAQKSDATSEPRSESTEESSSRESVNLPHQQEYCAAFPHPSLDASTLQFGLPSPLSSPSSALMTPTDEYFRAHPSVNGGHQMPRELDLASIFMTYPGVMGCDDTLVQVDRTLGRDVSHGPCLSKQNNGRSLESHCGCLNDIISYTAVLELSLRLRKATDILSRSANHRLGSSGCALNQRISDLDHFAKYVVEHEFFIRLY